MQLFAFPKKIIKGKLHLSRIIHRYLITVNVSPGPRVTDTEDLEFKTPSSPSIPSEGCPLSMTICFQSVLN